jgi:DNA polymerase III epsilon subunit-like protein
MSHRKLTSLAIAVRVYPNPPEAERTARQQKLWRRPDAMLVFDTETRIDATQRLTFGSYRFVCDGHCLEQALFWADDLPINDRRVLEQYVAVPHKIGTDNQEPELSLLTRREFLEKYRAVYKGRCLLVGFNLPFDLSRVAYDFTNARGRFAGGFALELWSYLDKIGHEVVNQYRPRIGIKHIDSKRALKGFTARNSPDRADLIPEDSRDGEPQEGYKFRGHFLDLRTLAFALTDRGYSLDAACKAFGVEHGKEHATHDGIVTEDYIHYNRTDVLATSELAAKLLEEYDKHPITLQPTRAYSPASIGKAYLRAMGIRPVLQRQPDFPKAYLGYAESALFGGRTSAHIRKVPVPVVYTDFLSMYPTVNSLMGLWQLVTAREVKVVEHCQTETHAFLGRFVANGKPVANDLFEQESWRQLAGFVQVIPDGDILPSRGKYSIESKDWQVAVNYLYAGDDNPKNALWFSLPDIVASIILTAFQLLLMRSVSSHTAC